MPVNRNALIRYRTIDNCLQNRQRRWTLEGLVNACSEALYEYEGIDKGVSKRSVQMDIQVMRSDKLGYNAPIVVLEKKYYTYEDSAYSITNIPLTDQDLGKLTEVVEILRQFKGFSHFQELSGMVQRLENKIHSAKTKQEPIIDFEKNEDLKGLEYIETLYQAIVNKKAVELTYQSFKARSANEFTFHPYYLKEYRNRWFVLGVRKRSDPIMNLALDRIIGIHESTNKYIAPNKGFNLNDYFQNVIGVTVNLNSAPEKIVLFADNDTAPYIITKPLHHSQQIVKRESHGTTFAICVQLNYELEREILGFGDRIKVIAPERFKRRIKEQLENALDRYQSELSESALKSISDKIEYKGSAILNHVYAKKEINLIKWTVYQFQKNNGLLQHQQIDFLLEKIPALKKLIFNINLQSILSKINRNLFLTKAVWLDKPDNQQWHQSTTISVKEKIETISFTNWKETTSGYEVCPTEKVLKNTIVIQIHLDGMHEQDGALSVIPGSQNKMLTQTEIQLITQSSIPVVCAVDVGGVLLMKPLLLHASTKTTTPRQRRVLHLEFNSMQLPNGLTWMEKLLE